VPPEYVGRSEIYIAVIGEATLVLELIDAGTGEVAAVVAERRAMGRGRVDSFSMPTNNATIIAEVRRWSTRAASKLRTELEKAIAGK
jgi:FixJ family two-component response regulator